MMEQPNKTERIMVVVFIIICLYFTYKSFKSVPKTFGNIEVINE